MYGEIANIIYKYYKDNGENDENFIREVYDIILNYMRLDNYVKNEVIIKDIITDVKKYHSVAMYFPDERVVEIYLNYKKLNYGLYPDLCDEFSKRLYFNIDVAHTIFHELDHAKYFKERDDKCNDIFHKLSECGEAEYIVDLYQSHKIGYFDLYKTVYRTKRMYKLHHDFVPIERRAIYTSLLEIEKVLFELIEYDINPVTFACYLGPHYYNEIINYKKYYKMKSCGVTTSPSYEYSNYVGYKNKLKQEEVLRYNNNLLDSFNYDVDRYSLEERLKYGLQLSNQELECVINSNQHVVDNCYKILINTKKYF